MPSAFAARARALAPGFALALLLAVLARSMSTLPGLRVLGPLTLALLVGIAVRAALGTDPRLTEGVRFSARTVLRLGIVLMGARLDFGLVARVGVKVLALDLAVVTLGIVGIAWLAQRLSVPRTLALLLAVGTSICGASAAVAAGTVLKAHEDEVTLAVALCGLLGTAGALLYVFAGPLLPLGPGQLAILAGSTLHEVAQVMAAAFTWGTAAGDLATLVKLVRVLLLAPALIVLGIVAARGEAGTHKWSFKEPPIPWFVIGFIAVGALNSLQFAPPAVPMALSTASVFLMTCAMAAMGLNTPLPMIRKAGPRAIGAGFLGFLALGVLAFVLIRGLSIDAV